MSADLVRGGVGVKFVELLVIHGDGRGEWLDDDLLHVRGGA